ncbi:MAG TPA: phosphatase [Clostridiales bacterium]|nr:phosphatase [Clostridiales bacterium]
MITIIADGHTHTVATDHAFSTISENTAYAAQLSHKIICWTEHSPKMPGGPSQLLFSEIVALPRYINGVMVIRGAELNIIDYEGGVDLPMELVKRLEWVIASYHRPCIDPVDVKTHTKGWIKIAENPHIHVIGHCGDPHYAFEHGPVLKAFKECGKIVEINARSFSARPGSRENCIKVAEECAELGIPIVVNSDAHHYLSIGDVGTVLTALEEMKFPEELILNADYNRFLETLRRTSGQELN